MKPTQTDELQGARWARSERRRRRWRWRWTRRTRRSRSGLARSCAGGDGGALKAKPKMQRSMDPIAVGCRRRAWL